MSVHDVHALICAEMTASRAHVMRNRDWDVTIKLASVCWLAETDGHRMLIDTSIGALDQDPRFAATYARLAAGWSWKVGGCLSALAAHGLDASDIDAVVLTHLHADHVADVAAFPRARFFVSCRGWNAASSETHPWLATYPQDVLDHLRGIGHRLVLCDDDEIVAPGVRVRWLGGHSPCSQAVVISTRAGLTAFPGDLVPLADNWRLRHPTGHYEDLRQVAEAYDFLGAFDAVVPSHDPIQPAWMGPRS
jgi:N-acyl homoserine lactone hydrolase